jgi:hypothetical protein
VLAVRQIVQLRGKSKVNKDQEAYFEYFPAGLRPQLTLWLYSIEVCRGAANPGAFFEQRASQSRRQRNHPPPTTTPARGFPSDRRAPVPVYALSVYQALLEILE